MDDDRAPGVVVSRRGGRPVRASARYGRRPRAAVARLARAVAVLGAEGPWGKRLVRRLAAEPGLRVLPLEARSGPAAARGLGDGTLVLADAPAPGEVAGTLELLEAAARAGVRKLVLRSSTLLYGPRPENPGFLPETSRLRAEPEEPRLRGLLEIERLAARLARRDPGLVVSLLRMAEVLGPGSDGPLAGYLRTQAVPTVMGFDPMVQLIHEDDAIEALLQAVRVDCGGAVNVAARPVLPLRRVVLLAGRVPAPVLNPLTSGLLRLADRVGLGRGLPLPLEYLTYPCVADDRRMRRELGFEPAHSAVDAIRDFAQRDRWERSRRR